MILDETKVDILDEERVPENYRLHVGRVTRSERGMKVQTPIIVRGDNVGAIFMAKNVAVSQRIKHIDVRYQFVQEFVMDEFLKIIFLRTAENQADIFTENVDGDLHGHEKGDYMKKEILTTGRVSE